jgi:hypothetical protein
MDILLLPGSRPCRLVAMSHQPPTLLTAVSGLSTTYSTRTERVRVTLGLAVYRQSVLLGDKPLETHDQYFFFQPNACGHSPYVTSSLTRGWVCLLQFVLALAIAVILMSESYGTHDHILLSQIRDSCNLEGQVPVFIYPPEQGGPVIPPGTGFPFIRLVRLAELLWKYSTTHTRSMTASASGCCCMASSCGHYPETNKASAHHTLFLECRFLYCSSTYIQAFKLIFSITVFGPKF